MCLFREVNSTDKLVELTEGRLLGQIYGEDCKNSEEKYRGTACENLVEKISDSTGE